MATKKKEIQHEANAVEEVRFSKEQLVASQRYSNLRDVLVAILDDEKSYTLEQVDILVNKFMKGKVK